MAHRPSGAWLATPVRSYTQGEFLARVLQLADALPDRRHMILLVRQRGDFLLCFCAALLRGQTILLPANATDGAVSDLVQDYSESFAITDSSLKLPVDNYSLSDLADGHAAAISADRARSLTVPAAHIAAILQTSGSTGKPQSHMKTWGQLVSGAGRLAKRLGLTAEDRIIATVPAQHMYGLETSILLPLQSGAGLYDAQPFYPGDVAAALAVSSRLGDRAQILVTTPFHLSACVREPMVWPLVQRVLCSTARLDPHVAEKSRSLFGAELTELYGSTETGAVATRRAPEDDLWVCLEGLEMHAINGAGDGRLWDAATRVGMPLTDNVEIVSKEKFRLLGRPADMLKIAGKRASLADLNIRLNRVSGVKDGAVFVRDRASGTSRLVAIVVREPGKEPRVREELASQVDPIFLPRKIYYVNELPRGATGKLADSALTSLLRTLDNR